MKIMKKNYVIILGLVILAIICFSASYAFFTSINEQHGKLNIVVGDLTYKLESIDLINDKILVPANTIKKIDISLHSLNNINSKYELYYTLDQENSNIRVGYDINTKDSVLGTIDANSSKEISVIVRNESDLSSTISFNVMGGLINDELVLANGNSLNQVVGRYNAYNIGDSVTATDGSKWHVLENSDEISSTVVLLSDFNLNSDGSYNTSCGKDINTIYRCSTMIFDPNDTNIYDVNDSNNIGYFIENTYKPLVTMALVETTNVTLPTAAQIALADGKTFDELSIGIDSSWLLTTNYWTKTDYTSLSYDVWGVFGEENNLSYNYVGHSTHYGARPVITTLKTNLISE